MKAVGSRSNPLYKALMKLKDSARERRDEKSTLLDGAHLVAAYLERMGKPHALIVAASARDSTEIAALAAAVAPLEPVVLADALFRELSPVTTPSGVLAAVRIPDAKPVPPTVESCILLEDIQDPGNLGSILRSAAAADVGHVLLSRGCVDAWAPRVLRAGMGAHFSLNIVERADLVGFAREYRGLVIATAARASRVIYDLDLTGPCAFVMGNEGAGLSSELAAVAGIEAGIPMPGGVESLNVGAALAVCLFERVRQRRVPGRSTQTK